MTESNHTQQLEPFKILVVGDVCVDNYQYGIVDRISPEAPVPVFVPTREESRNGMAANVAANLVALGCEVVVASGQHGSKTRLID